MNKLVLDSSAWIECLAGTSKGKQVQTQITSESKIYITGMIVAEVVAKYLREHLSIEQALAAIKSHSILISFDIALGEQTARIYVQQRARQKKFGLVDAHVVAVAQAVGAKLITCDFEFSGLPNVMIIQ